VIFADLECWVGRHFVLECVFVFTVVTKEDIFINVKHSVFNILLSKGRKELSIQIIGNSAAVEHFTDHILQDGSVNLLDLVLLRSGAD
jgi:hypothetical protein